MKSLQTTTLDENENLRRELVAARQQIAELEGQEQRYRNIFENAAEGIFQISPDGRFLLANPAMAHILGYTTPEDLLESVTNARRQFYVHDADYLFLIEKLETSNVVQNFEAQFYRADGHIIWLTFNVHALKNSAGELLYYEGTAQDISEHKEIEDTLGRRESQLTEVQEMVHLGNWEWDVLKNTVTWSKELYRIYGLDQDIFKVTLEGYLERVHPDDRERVQQIIRGSAVTAEPFHFEERIIRPDGTERVLESIGKVVVNEQGQPVRLVGSCLDITDRKTAERQIKETAARAEALVQTAAYLNAHIDLDTVLTTICEQTAQAFQVSAVSVSLYDESKQRLYHGKSFGLPPEYDQRVLAVEAPTSFLEGAENQTKSFLIRSDARRTRHDPNAALYTDMDIHTIISAGLVHEQHLVGTLNLHVRHQQRVFTESELILLKGLSDQAALAIINAQLHESEKEQAATMLTLYENSNDLISILDPDLLLNQIVQRAVQLVKADRGLILLVDTEARMLEKLVHSQNKEVNLADSSYQEIEDGISGWVLAHGEPVMSEDLVSDPRNTGLALASALDKTDDKGKYIIVAPLKARGKTIGTLTTITDEGGKAFTQADLELVLMMANQAAIAIENARLYQASKEYTAVLEERVLERTAELEKQNQALVRARERAEAADRLKSVFLAIMSHELRTPLNSIIGFTGVILQELAGPLNQEQTKQLSMIKESAQHLLSLINDVLDISKIEAGQMTLEVGAVDIPALLAKVVASLQQAADKKGLPLTVDLDPAVSIITSDARRVEQILINLVGNAIKFTEAGYVQIKCAFDENHYLLTRIVDTGIGISPDDRDKLFRPFSQIESGLSRHHDGTGLGLSICRRLVEMLGGEIWVESQPGVGSTFSFTLPVEG